MNFIIRVRRWMTMSRRVAAFSLLRQQGISDSEAIQRVNDMYPPTQEQLQYEEKRVQKLQQ